MESSIKEKVWNGTINVNVRYRYRDGDGTLAVEYLLTIHRLAYFPLYFNDILNYISHFAVLPQGPVWLETEGDGTGDGTSNGTGDGTNSIPLKWNLPAGVLYDYHCNTPIWQLNLKTGSYPPDLIPFATRDDNDKIDINGHTLNYGKSLQENFFNQLKQSNFVINGNAKMVMNLSKDDSTQFWEAVASHNLANYEILNKKMLPKRVTKVPVKVYTPNSTFIQLPLASGDLTLEEMLAAEGLGECCIQGIRGKALESVKMTDIWRLFKHLDNFLYIILTN